MNRKLVFFMALFGITIFGISKIEVKTYNSKMFSSIMALSKVEALGWSEFIILQNGKVGIYNNVPDYALTIGKWNDCNQIALIYGVWNTTSDIRFKKNIRDLNNALSVVNELRGVGYNLVNDTTGREVFGFIANEVRKTLPNLVYEDSLGYLSLNYDGFIPVLATAIKEQQAQIENQQKQIDELRELLKSAEIFRSSAGTSSLSAAVTSKTAAVLYQNNPNPWSETTEIRYTLPDDARDAAVYIFDFSGKLLKTLNATGSSSVLLKGADLKAGIYFYSLVVAGSIVDTKQMILTN